MTAPGSSSFGRSLPPLGPFRSTLDKLDGQDDGQEGLRHREKAPCYLLCGCRLGILRAKVKMPEGSPLFHAEVNS